MYFEEGILVGCDSKLEWLLPWWWSFYSKHNTRPVAFADFGMSKFGIEWCKERGIYVSFPLNKVEKPIEAKAAWELLYGEQFWDFRSSWFQKPLACLNSPFNKTIWIDMDCRVEGDFSAFFNLLHFGVEIALLKEQEGSQQTGQELGILERGEISYNSGVVGFIKNAPTIDLWAKLGSTHFPGDQQALSRSIHLLKPPLIELPEIYNWSFTFPHNPQAIITHFHGPKGKMHILQELQVTGAKLKNFSLLFDSPYN